MFTFTLKVVLEPETKALLSTLIDLLRSHQQGQVDALANLVGGLTQRLATSQTALQAATNQ